ncbi:MAG: HipA domain-containing protein [Mucilaginibacter sp.]
MNPKTWIPFIAKTAEKWYPHESVIEYMINRVGETLGIAMNEVMLCRINGQIRFLSRYFLRRDESLIHGAEICGEFLEDMEMAKQIADEKKSARELFTFEFIAEAVKAIFPGNYEAILLDLVWMLAFDALVGNNDRHFYNWGIIAHKKKSNQLPRFAPVYDSARGLLWNVSDENIGKWLKMQQSGGMHIARYINDACPRISVEGDKEIGHFALMAFLKARKPAYRETIDGLASLDSELAALTMLEKEFYSFFNQTRRELTGYIIRERFKKIREV